MSLYDNLWFWYQPNNSKFPSIMIEKKLLVTGSNLFEKHVDIYETLDGLNINRNGFKHQMT